MREWANLRSSSHRFAGEFPGAGRYHDPGMLTHPAFDPIAFKLGPLPVHWYGITYVVAFGLGWWLGRLRARRSHQGWRTEDVDDVLFFFAVGVIVGGRMGYILFYDFASVMRNPLSVFALWRGGMSFHGGLIGVLVAMAVYARRRGRRFFEVSDFIAPLVPLGLGAGRIGNFINGNLWGKESSLPFAMVFPKADALPRHPSQLYQVLLEGLVLFAVLWAFSRRPRPTMAVSGLFLLGYATFRSLVEFVRVPDAQYGYLAFGWLTMGQVLSTPMAVAGLGLLWLAYRRGEMPPLQPPPRSPPASGTVSRATPSRRPKKRKPRR